MWKRLQIVLAVLAFIVSSLFWVNRGDKVWDQVVVGMDIRDARKLLGPSDATLSDDTQIWFSTGAYFSFPVFYRVLELRSGACSSCGDEEYQIVSKSEYPRIFLFFVPER